MKIYYIRLSAPCHHKSAKNTKSTNDRCLYYINLGDAYALHVENSKQQKLKELLIILFTKLQVTTKITVNNSLINLENDI